MPHAPRTLVLVFSAGLFLSACSYGVKMDERSCDQGDAGACFDAAVAYSAGHMVEQDFGKAADLFSKAAGMGHALAQWNYGSLYEVGLGVPQDPYTAYVWYRAAALKGVKKAARSAEDIAWQLTEAERVQAEKDARQLP